MNRVEHNCEQGTAEWHRMRLGVPTASHFKDFITPKGKPAANEARENYLADLGVERITGKLPQGFVTDAMKRGTELEPKARRWYQLETGRKVRTVGFITPAMGSGLPACGYSPDGIVEAAAAEDGVERLIEIKCPEDRKMFRRLMDGDVSEYALQMQAGMWIAGVAVCDLVLFTDAPGLPNRIITVSADKELHAAFQQIVGDFCEELDKAELDVLARGGERQAVQGSDEAANAIMDSMAPMPAGQGRG